MRKEIEIQKIIKYFAIAFAVFITISIFSAIYYVGLELGNTIINIPSEHKQIDINIIDNHVAVLNIDLDFSKLIIRSGKKLEIKTNKEYVDCKQLDNKVSISEKKRGFFRKIKNNEVILYVPDNLAFKQVYISNGAGTINIEKIVTKKLKLEIGAGKVSIDKLFVSENASIESGAGEVTIHDSEIHALDLDMGVGKLTINTILTGSNEIDAGIGALNVNFLDSNDNYKIKLSKGLGPIKVDGNTVGNNETYGTGSNSIDIDGGIGSININFNK